MAQLYSQRHSLCGGVNESELNSYPK